MKTLLLAFCLMVTALSARAQNLAPLIQAEAEKCAKVLMANDYAGVLGYTHERVVNLMGGQEAARNLLRKSMEEMKAKGLGITDTKIGTPEPPRKVGKWTISVVPESITLRMPGSKAQQDSFLLGISEDDGKTWKFIDLGPISEEQLFNVFPELKGQFKMPAKKQATVEKTP